MNLNEFLAAFDYDPGTGLIRWKVSPRNGVQAGDIAGNPMAENDYLQIGIFRKRFMAHRVAWLLHYGEWPEGQIDHINQDRQDNRITNLRVVTNQGNARNQKQFCTNTSGVTGVIRQPDCNRWRAQIGVDYKCRQLGLYEDWFDAVCARKAAENELGFHPNHGRKL